MRQPLLRRRRLITGALAPFLTAANALHTARGSRRCWGPWLWLAPGARRPPGTRRACPANSRPSSRLIMEGRAVASPEPAGPAAHHPYPWGRGRPPPSDPAPCSWLESLKPVQPHCCTPRGGPQACALLPAATRVSDECPQGPQALLTATGARTPGARHLTAVPSAYQRLPGAGVEVGRNRTPAGRQNPCNVNKHAAYGACGLGHVILSVSGLGAYARRGLGVHRCQRGGPRIGGRRRSDGVAVVSIMVPCRPSQPGVPGSRGEPSTSTAARAAPRCNAAMLAPRLGGAVSTSIDM
jgi:hypothetical protein